MALLNPRIPVLDPGRLRRGTRRRRALRLVAVTVLATAGWGLWATEAAAAQFSAPVDGPLAVARAFDPPEQPWLPGHRGVDLFAPSGAELSAAAGGMVSFAGIVAGRGVIAIDHGRIRTTYEPVEPMVTPGQRVLEGQPIGRLAGSGWHCSTPCLHWGARIADQYLDPLSLLRPPQVRLLPHLEGPGTPNAGPPTPRRPATPSGDRWLVSSEVEADQPAAETDDAGATTASPATRPAGTPGPTTSAAAAASALTALAAGIGWAFRNPAEHRLPHAPRRVALVTPVTLNQRHALGSHLAND